MELAVEAEEAVVEARPLVFLEWLHPRHLPRSLTHHLTIFDAKVHRIRILHLAPVQLCHHQVEVASPLLLVHHRCQRENDRGGHAHCLLTVWSIDADRTDR